MILLPRASILLNKSLTRLKSDLCWNTIARFWARNLTTYSVPFFVYHLGQQIFSSHTVLGQWHTSLDSRIIQKIPWLGWNANYVETLQRVSEREIWQRIGYFFVYTLDQKFFPYQTVLRQWHSSLEPQIIWISPWLGWKAIYVETLYSDILIAKLDNLFSTFFVYHLGQQLLSSHTVLGQWHSSLDPQLIWISPWLGWKAIYVETL